MNSRRSFDKTKNIGSLLAVFYMLVLNVYAQEVNQDTKYDHARFLYSKGAYLAARQEFETITDDKYLESAQYYLASSAVRSGQRDGEYLVEKFVNTYPESPLSQNVYYDLGNYFYGIGDYQKAINNFNRSSSIDKNELSYKRGYAYFQLNKYPDALESLQQVSESSDYYADAAYFLGYIHYADEDFEKSHGYLLSAFESEDYQDDALMLYASSLYQLEKYQEVIDLIEGLEEGQELQPEVQNYLADSYYAVGNFRLAKNEFTELFQKTGFRTEQNYFKAGFSSYKIENRDEAVDWLKRSAISDDTVGAYASYYLGVIYHDQGNLPFASTSFGNTAKYDTKLKEEATYLQGKTYMEIPNYTEAIKVLSSYLEDYPNGVYVDITNDMIASAYSHTSNYDLAMDYFEKLDYLTRASKKLYQRVTFVKGSSLFNNKQFKQATEVFQKSLIHNVDAELTQQTYYWLGECYTLLGQYDESLFYYQSINKFDPSLYLKSQYGLGYAYFNMQDYETAQGYFEQVIKDYTPEVSQKYLQDAYLRLGDCQFALKAYDASLVSYNQALSNGSKNKAQLYYQMGLVHKYKGEPDQAKSYFKKLTIEVPSSPKVEHAQFQMAQIDYEKGNDLVTIQSYRQFILDHPSSLFVPYALINQAVAYENTGDGDASITNYKTVLERFPRHEMAKSALLALQDKSAAGKLQGFDEYLEIYKKANPNSLALENIEFETAKSKFYSQDYEGAIQGLNNFVSVYPESSLKAEAYYFAGDAHYRLDQLDLAKTNFEKIKVERDFAKHTKVLYRLAEIESNQGNLDQGNSYYYQMAQSNPSARNIIFLKRGLMENYFKLQQYDSTIVYAKELLDNSRINVQIESKANLLMGEALYFTNQLDEAVPYLEPLVTNTPDEAGAEAYYYLSRIHYDKKDTQKALDGLFELTSNFYEYEFWLGKAYLLMADIYVETDEVFQAKATLNSVVENSTLPEIINEAKQKLETIETDS